MSQIRSLVELNASAFNANIAWYKKAIQQKLLGIVIKSNAYGHGLSQIAQLVQYNKDVDWICVAGLGEAVLARSYGVQKPILVLYHLDEDPALAAQQQIDLMVTDIDTLHALNSVGQEVTRPIHVHIKVDTGLSRFGFAPDAVLPVVELITQLPHLKLRGIYTHLAEAANADQYFTHQQLQLFNALVQELHKQHSSIPFVHVANSAAATLYSDTTSNLVRVGLGVYGLWPSVFTKENTQLQCRGFELTPILSWKTRIEFIKTIEAGQAVGYDRTFKAERTMRVAVLPVGYVDGYDRRLSNKGWVRVNNCYAPVIGRIAMTTMMIDITHANAHIGDEVLLVGPHERVHPVDIAVLMESYNPREFLTGIHERILRVVTP